MNDLDDIHNAEMFEAQVEHNASIAAASSAYADAIRVAQETYAAKVEASRERRARAMADRWAAFHGMEAAEGMMLPKTSDGPELGTVIPANGDAAGADGGQS